MDHFSSISTSDRDPHYLQAMTLTLRVLFEDSFYSYWPPHFLPGFLSVLLEAGKLPF